MEQWGLRHRVKYINQDEDQGSQLPYDILNEEESSDDEEEEKAIKTEPDFLPETRKRKCRSLSQLREVKEESCEKRSGRKLKSKRNESKDRWSAERYNLAEQSMWEVLKAEGATFDNPITRPALRMAARKRIGDTGLLDHLLKHIDGKVAPGGIDRFRRWFNTNGIMEYWLESADLDKVRQEAGVQNPFWMPPSTFRAGGAPSQDTDSSCDLKLLKIEMAQMKKDMQELIAKKQDKSEISLMEETHKEFLKWRAVTDRHLTEIMASMKGLQGKYGELVIWKTKFEQQLVEITNKLSDHQASRGRTAFSSYSEKWKDWIEGTNIENIQDDEFATWIGGSSELLNVPQEVVLGDPNSAPPAQFLIEAPTNKKSESPELLPARHEDQPNVTPDSSTTVTSNNSKSDIDNSLMMFQDMFMDLYKWKDKMEQQLLELSNTVYGGMLAMK
ncbi:hypothetical protein TanjilG_11550 [Lupinus angustifolius]|uniref:PTC1-like winged helix-turn-helix domain-containing protein n=1 Tax=Lupinus angustifolius TaxID=3871 RepID=A0A394DFM4_LUPAN|nr:PREDICTED: protein DYAD-like isoform X2 [Lupinus angustifolius]OIW21815.1 hypothetical protein TanjilG_11550 [Lupinus angustifolius]